MCFSFARPVIQLFKCLAEWDPKTGFPIIAHLFVAASIWAKGMK